MANMYTADQNERSERLDRISSLIGSYLLRGYKMLADECATCSTVLLEVMLRCLPSIVIMFTQYLLISDKTKEDILCWV